MIEHLRLEKGLVLIRYVAHSSGKASAIIRASIDMKDAAKGSVISDPFSNDNELVRPGQCLVVRCGSPLSLVLDIRSAIEGEQPRGSVRVEYLTRSANASKPADQKTQELPPEVLATFRLVGHVAYLGDVPVDNGAWLCGPGSPNRIEGIKLVWPEIPAGLQINYRVNGGEPRQIGQYAGSKGKSVPIKGIEVWCDGPLSRSVLISVEGLFVQAGGVSASGKVAKLTGRGPKDELIGLKILLTLSDPPIAAASKLQQKARVQIFRD